MPAEVLGSELFILGFCWGEEEREIAGELSLLGLSPNAVSRVASGGCRRRQSRPLDQCEQVGIGIRAGLFVKVTTPDWTQLILCANTGEPA